MVLEKEGLLVLGTAENFRCRGFGVEKINHGMRKNYETNHAPRKSLIRKEYRDLAHTLFYFGREFVPVEPLETVPQQLAPCDLGVRINQKFVVAEMTCESRKREIEALLPILKQSGLEIIRTPKGIKWEGANVCVEKRNKRLVIGLNHRTSPKIVDWFKKEFSEFKVKRLRIRKSVKGTHLDTVFKPLLEGLALAYTRGIDDLDGVLNQYKLLKLTKAEAEAGGANVFLIDEKTILIRADKKLARVRRELKNKGFNVIPIRWTETKKTGTGGPNCAILSLN